MEESRNPHTNPSLRTIPQKWAVPSSCWAGSQLFPASDGVCGRHSSTEKDTQEAGPAEQDAAGPPSERDTAPRWLRLHTGAPPEGRKSHQHQVLNTSGLHGDPAHNPKLPSTRHLKPLLTEKNLRQGAVISQVPLRLQIKVSGQRGSLGISIAGGRGSLPYRDRDEGIFISRVSKGGPSERAGLHVGDRLLEVNGLSMQGATHLEAVGALRNAGNCIQMRVLREGLRLREVSVPDEGQLHLQDGGEQRLQKVENAEDGRKIEAVVCNGHGISGTQAELQWPLPRLEAEASTKCDSLQAGKHTMAIPRIILTHPSTSDEDVELLTQSPGREASRDSDAADRRALSDSFDSAFYPP